MWIKTKSLHCPWIKKGITKSLKRNQKPYEKYLKKRANETETAYKLYKNLFESIKRRSKQNLSSEKLLRLKYNSKKIWAVVMKEMIGEMTSKSSNLPKNYNCSLFFEYFLNKSDFL